MDGIEPVKKPFAAAPRAAVVAGQKGERSPGAEQAQKLVGEVKAGEPGEIRRNIFPDTIGQRQLQWKVDQIGGRHGQPQAEQAPVQTGTAEEKGHHGGHACAAVIHVEELAQQDQSGGGEEGENGCRPRSRSRR